jgi:asparagine synthase (glutamine-hydrolysing)
MISRDGQSWITYNGEVYNFESLRTDLGRLKSRTDTEVVLELFLRDGVDSLARMRGMFAFAVWDEPAQTLTLARDPFGIKPLYYTTVNQSFLFASEIRALLESGLVRRRLSQEGVQSYLATGSVDSPGTIIEGVHSLPPGSFLQVRFQHGPIADTPRCYAPFPDPDSCEISRPDAAHRLREILTESLRLHQISDVPWGVFLSGGIDSSALVALSKLVSPSPPKTFAVIFSEKKFSEHDHARAVANVYGTDHREIMLSENGMLAELPEGVASLDQPSIDGFNTYVISKAVKQAGITVALSGLGGDELFAGYASFRRARWMRSLSVAPMPLRRCASTIGSFALNGSVQRSKFWELVGSEATPDAAYRISRRLFTSSEVRDLTGTPARAASSAAFPNDAVNRVSQLEMQGYMANTLLRDTDSMSMAHALEVRVPFVDTEVAHFVLGLPGNWKLDPRRPKPLLLDALQGMLPDSIWNRPKMGFALPFERWMHSALKAGIDRTFATADWSAVGLNSQHARMLWGRFIDRPASEKWSRSWALYVLQRWCEKHEVTI